jgi:hypothetical protein
MRRDNGLYRAALHHFGTWRQALEAAGIDVRHAHLNAKPRQLDRKRILDALQQRHQAGLSLSWSEVCLENRAIATAAKNAFGCWRSALVAAGIQPEVHQTAFGNRWDKQRVIAEIQSRQRQEKPLTYRAVDRDDAALLRAARRYFGQWRTALEAADVVSEDRTEQIEGG